MKSFMDSSYSRSSKQRRDLLKNETDRLGRELPFDYGKISQLRILKAACNYMKKEKYFANLNSNKMNESPLLNSLISCDETLRNEGLSGFIVCFTKCGKLVYMSDTSYEHLGLRSMDLMFTYDSISDMIHEQDKHFFKDLETNFDKYRDGRMFSFYSLWFVSKIKRNEKSLIEYKLIKLTGHFDAKTDLYIATCIQILSVSNRDIMPSISADCFTSVHDHCLGFQEISTNVENLLGYNLNDEDFGSKTLYELVSPQSLALIKERHLQILTEKNTKGYLDPIKLLHRGGFYVDCLVNLYCDLKDHIICKYQVVSPQNMLDYKEYVMNFKRDWEVYKFQENATSSSLNIDTENSINVKPDNDYSNFIAIEETNALMSSNTENFISNKRQHDTFEYDQRSIKRVRTLTGDSNEPQVNYYQSSSSPYNEEPLNDVESPVVTDEFGNQGSLSSDEISYFGGIDLNEIFEINSIKEDIEKEMNLLLPSFKDEKKEFFLTDKEEFNQTFCGSDEKNFEYANNENTGYIPSQYNDEQLYKSLIDDYSLFQSLQAF